MRLFSNNLHSSKVTRSHHLVVPDVIGDPGDLYFKALCNFTLIKRNNLITWILDRGRGRRVEEIKSFNQSNLILKPSSMMILILCMPLLVIPDVIRDPALKNSSFHCSDKSLSADLQIVVQAQKTKKVSIGLVNVGKHDASLDAFIDRLKTDLEWSGQCKVITQKKDNLHNVSELKTIFAGDITLAIFISKSGLQYTWRLYDIMSAEMIVGKTVMQEDKPIALLAHTVADELWPELFGQKSSFCSKIAFCKQIWRKKHGREKPYKQIWITDFDGSNPKLFIDAPTVSFAPRWNKDLETPLLFYSENTMSNVQLVMSNMFYKRKVVYCFDGLNMQPAFSEDGKRVVLCLSKDGTSQLYLSHIDGIAQRRKLDRLTFNDGNNIAPCFIDNTHVAFVSDFDTHKPQLYIMNLSDESLKCITDGGYCACPNYSKVRHQLVYSRMIGSGMQLFTYDVKTQEHKQITQGGGSKEEASWSACGNYIVFGLNQGLKSRIAQLNMITGKVSYLTSEHDHCTYPDCSPIYSKNIGILNA